MLTPAQGLADPRSPGQGSGGPGAQTLEPEEILGILKDHLQASVGDGRRRVEIKDARGLEKMTLPEGVLSREITVPDQALRGGSMTASIRFLVNGREVKRLKVVGKVEIYADVVSARYFLNKHQEIQEKDLQWENRNISAMPADLVTDMKEIVGKRTTLSINRNEVLRRGMAELIPAVKRGDRVLLVAERPQFKITTLGEAKEEGRKGERIKLVNLSSKKEVYGRVLDANTVQIDF